MRKHNILLIVVLCFGLVSGVLAQDTTLNDETVNNLVYEGSNQNDQFRNDGIVKDNSIVSGNGGNDKIVNEFFTQIPDASFIDTDIDGDAGNDTIDNRVGGTILDSDVNGGSGNDVILNAGTVIDSPLKGGSNNDRFDSSGTIKYKTGAIAIDAGSGNDTVIISGDVRVTNGSDATSVIGGQDNDSILISSDALVEGDIFGNSNTSAGGDTIEVKGKVVGDVIGDDITTDGGNDSIFINGSDGVVTGNVIGDVADDTGGDDTLKVRNGAQVQGSVHGDGSDGDGGSDEISVGSGSQVKGDVVGDAVNSNSANGSKDTITISGVVSGNVHGDHVTDKGDAADDDIEVTAGGRVEGRIAGDVADSDGGDDSFKISGVVEGMVRGDDVSGEGGDDFILLTGSGVASSIHGDYSAEDGGNDTIKIRGTVLNTVSGDNYRGNSTMDGGNDFIRITPSGNVLGNVFGDNTQGDGGNDTIVVAGLVAGNVYGDMVDGQGGLDYIEVTGKGVVNGDVFGDKAGTPANFGTVGADDTIIINGTVNGTVDPDGSIGGHDVIVVAGQITGNIASSHDNGVDGDDVFVIRDGGVVGGVMDAGSHINGDSLVFDLSTKLKNEYRDLARLFDGLTADDGTVTYRDNTYNWVNFEFLQYVIQFFETRYVELRCSGIYEKNDAGTACQRKGQEEYDAIMFHRNNPGYDGRLPGTESCAIYNYGNAMRVYEVVDGSEGELVTTISADVFSHNIESNLLLASSASGNVNVYYLTSNEVQVECTDWTGKTQVRIIPDFSGTVNASFDKET